MSFEMCVTIDQYAHHPIPIILNFREHRCKNLRSHPVKWGVLTVRCLTALFFQKKIGTHELQVSYYVITSQKTLKFLGEDL